MIRIENKTFTEGQLQPFQYDGYSFVNCRFKMKLLPNFHNCEFHDCDLSYTKARRMTYSKLFSSNLDGVDFSNASLLFSETSRCSAHGCKWQGAAVILDCRWFSGLLTGDDVWQLVAMGLVPESPFKKEIYKSIPGGQRSKVRKVFKEEFRTP
jgi:uncharacterized protein YjbI with pentapeptide repeats